LIDLPDVSTETGFREFYYHWNNYVSVSYDEDAPWFRWTINCDKTELNHLLQEKMQVQEETDADAKILKYKTESGETLLNYQNIQKTIQKAEIDSIEVVNRGTDGSVIQLQIKYRTGGILNIYTATAIREWLGSSLWEIHKQDGSDFTGWSILPSAFFYVETQRDEITVYGGGFGHGTGMSQNAAKTMGMKGFSYQEILTFFYKKGT
jgi:stage II sporulation protein D